MTQRTPTNIVQESRWSSDGHQRGDADLVVAHVASAVAMQQVGMA